MNFIKLIFGVHLFSFLPPIPHLQFHTDTLCQEALLKGSALKGSKLLWAVPRARQHLHAVSHEFPFARLPLHPSPTPIGAHLAFKTTGSTTVCPAKPPLTVPGRERGSPVCTPMAPPYSHCSSCARRAGVWGSPSMLWDCERGQGRTVCDSKPSG